MSSRFRRLFVGLADTSAFAATTEVYLDTNGTAAGDGNPGIGASANATYLWSTSAAGAYWNTSGAINNTGTPQAWVTSNYIANFGGYSTDSSGWAYTMAYDSTVTHLEGINVGAAAQGTLTVTPTGSGTNFYLAATQTWNVYTGSNLIFGNGVSLNLNHENLTLQGGGNVTFASNSKGFFNTSSNLIDNLTGVMTISNATQNGEFDWSGSSSFTVNSGTLAIGSP